MKASLRRGWARLLGGSALIVAPLFALVAALLAPAAANATATVRVEYVLAIPPTFQTGQTSNQLAELDGTPQSQSVTGTGSPITFSAAPSFSTGNRGFARIEVTSGAADCAWGSSPAPATAGVRIDTTTGPVFAYVQTGNTVACVEDAAGAVGASLPTNAAQETGGNLAGAKSDLDAIVTNTTGAATAANQTATQANAGSSSSKATGVQGVAGGLAIATKQQDSAGNDATDTTNHAVKVTIQAAAVTAPVKPQDSGGGDATDATYHAVKTSGLTPNYVASGVTSVTGTFTTGSSAGAVSSALPLKAGRPFIISLWNSTTPGAALGGTVYLTCSVDGGTTYLPQTANGVQLESFTTTTQDQWIATQYGETCELVLLATPTQTINYRLDQ